ncbi:dihydroneopterin aldolase [Alicycliphilus denitrificans]|mgnify:FL=1|jgi:dihydroneopterin aldolase|uniref:dihydroneopterin aldolase n=1 Tax=Alicycliphilus denitrificans TaxID=179636 RepID=A0A3R7LG99_9BURK|nr:dihydroneopterin aldolase [Alicycliphilus denitrificans]MBN9572729.1 dihydroneopterin aldolase [Alicycliphilus denitrificans]OJW92569.1 MAG: diguanylate cyclase [Alicycliphilus sp. 69-12]RKJ98275.1 dihydroneopterin aldolase [Alicycliphilus denitrificans]BCN37317.1 dihydroneopterin aldolase [Alicycliphilus denitrificans]
MNSILLAFGAIDARLATGCRALSLRRHEAAVRIGVHAHERLAAQRMWFDVDLCVKLDHAPAARDHISETLDYDFIREVIAREVGGEHHELQESLCDAIAAALLQSPGVHAVRVATRKPDIYPDSASIGVERVCIKPW